jgi:hypothetical protein
MRAIVIAAAVMLAGCGYRGFPAEMADRARSICRENGHTMPSAGFDECFAQTYTAIMTASAPPR